MKQFLLAASLLMFIGSQASAAFLNNRQEWNDATTLQKIGFVQGVFAELVTIWTTDSESIATQKTKLNKCAVEMGLTSSSMVDIVDKHYDDLENWSQRANIALRLGLLKICKNFKE